MSLNLPAFSNPLELKATLGLDAKIEAHVQAGLDPETRALIESLPESIRDNVIREMEASGKRLLQDVRRIAEKSTDDVACKVVTNSFVRMTQLLDGVVPGTTSSRVQNVQKIVSSTTRSIRPDNSAANLHLKLLDASSRINDERCAENAPHVRLWMIQQEAALKRSAQIWNWATKKTTITSACQLLEHCYSLKYLSLQTGIQKLNKYYWRKSELLETINLLKKDFDFHNSEIAIKESFFSKKKFSKREKLEADIEKLMLLEQEIYFVPKKKMKKFPAGLFKARGRWPGDNGGSNPGRCAGNDFYDDTQNPKKVMIGRKVSDWETLTFPKFTFQDPEKINEYIKKSAQVKKCAEKGNKSAGLCDEKNEWCQYKSHGRGCFVAKQWADWYTASQKVKGKTRYNIRNDTTVCN